MYREAVKPANTGMRKKLRHSEAGLTKKGKIRPGKCDQQPLLVGARWAEMAVENKEDLRCNESQDPSMEAGCNGVSMYVNLAL